GCGRPPIDYQCDARAEPVPAPRARSASLPPRHKALATEHHMRVLPARKRKPEVIEPMIEALTGDHDAEIAHVGKVGQTELPRHRLLTKDDVSLGAVQRRRWRVERDGWH